VYLLLIQLVDFVRFLVGNSSSDLDCVCMFEPFLLLFIGQRIELLEILLIVELIFYTTTRCCFFLHFNFFVLILSLLSFTVLTSASFLRLLLSHINNLSLLSVDESDVTGIFHTDFFNGNMLSCPLIEFNRLRFKGRYEIFQGCDNGTWRREIGFDALMIELDEEIRGPGEGVLKKFVP
jgi:hypothetical protein